MSGILTLNASLKLGAFMKKIIIASLLLSTSVFAGEYICTATLKSAGVVTNKQLEISADNVSSATIKYFAFHSIETKNSTLILSVVNQKEKIYLGTSSTTFIPKEGIPSDLRVQLKDGYAEINCEAN